MSHIHLSPPNVPQQGRELASVPCLRWFGILLVHFFQIVFVSVQLIFPHGFIL
jgi:hypothetical protein